MLYWGGGRGDMGVGARELLTFEFFTVDDINPGVLNGSKSITGNQSIIINYSQLPLRRTPLGPAVSVRLREMSIL